MNKEKVIELVNLFREVNYKDLFGALVLNEKVDSISEVNNKDWEYLEELYDKFMDCDYITGLINVEELEEL